MSENITHTAVTDDCARLALHSPAICRPFKLCLEKHLEIARLGGITRSGGGFVVRLLGGYREAWSGRQEGDMLEEKLAFVLGWLCHRAADLQMKPVFRALDADCAESPTDCSVYHDVFLFREVYASGRREPYAPGILGAGDAAAIEDALQSMWQRALIAIHTFIPDQADIEGWMERLFRTRQRFYVDIRRYAEAFHSPDPERMRRFVQEARFYDRDDPLIRLARSLQEGTAEGTIDLQRAVEDGASQSLYARALSRGYRYLLAASDYFRGEIGEEVLKDRLERGKQGVSA